MVQEVVVLISRKQKHYRLLYNQNRAEQAGETQCESCFTDSHGDLVILGFLHAVTAGSCQMHLVQLLENRIQLDTLTVY